MTVDTQIGKTFTIEEVYEQFPDQWVLLADPVTNEKQEVLSGRLLAHGEDKDEVYSTPADPEVRHLASLYTRTKPLPSDEAIVL